MTHYERLGVDPLASMEEVHAAYLSAARRLHPDLNQGQESEEFLAIKQAHDVLYDEMKRRLYDDTGLDSERDKLDVAAAGIIQQLAISVISKKGIRVNLVTEIRNGIEHNIAKGESLIEEQKRKARNAEQNHADVSARWSGGNELAKRVVVNWLESQVEQAKDAASQLEKELGTLKRAYEIMSGAVYDVPLGLPSVCGDSAIRALHRGELRTVPRESTLIAWMKRLFCWHRGVEFFRNIWGDEIFHSGGKRSVWRCLECGADVYKDHLHKEWE